MATSCRCPGLAPRTAGFGVALLLGPALIAQPVAAQLAPSQEEPAAPAASSTPLSTSLSPVASAQGWSGTFELYGLLPWIQSTTTVRDLDTDASLGPSQLLQALQSTYSFRGSVEKDRLGLILDFNYNQLGAQPSRSGPRGLVNLNTDLSTISGVYDLALRWRFGDRERAVGQPGSWSVIPYAGMRMVQARLDVAAQLIRIAPFNLGTERLASLDHNWVQPVVGTQATLFLSPRLRLFARGDIGGFGLAGAEDLSGNAQVGFGYAVGNTTDLNLSWRYQGLRWSNGAERSNGFSLDENGVEVGVKFFF